MTLETLKVVITADASGFNKQITSVKNSLAKLDASISNSTNGISQSLKSITKSVSFVAITAGLTKLASTAINTASTLKEVQNVVDQAFGKKYNKEVDDFAKNAINQFGLSELAAKKYSSTLMAMGTSMGITADKSKTMAIQLTGLAADLASFYNTDVETAYIALQGAYTGITRALRQYGINMSEAEVKNYALSKGITTTYDALSEAEKATLRYNYILEHSTLAQNDFINTHKTWANSLKIISNQFEQLASILGTFMMSILTPIVHLLSQIVGYAIQAAQALAKMFGVSLSFSNGGSDIAGTWDDATDATNEASNAAKKYKKLIDGFDELNIQTSESGSGSQGAFGGGFDVGSYFDITEGQEKLLDFNKWLEDIDAWLVKAEESFEELGITIGQKLNSLFNYVNWNLLGKTVADGLNNIIITINRFFDTAAWAYYGQMIAQAINSFINHFDWKEFGQSLVNKFNAAFEMLRGFVFSFNWESLGDAIVATVRSALDNINFTKIGYTLAGLLNGLSTIIAKWPETFPIEEIANNIYKAINTFINDVDWAQLGSNLNKLITQVFNAIDNIDFNELSAAFAAFLEELDIVGLLKHYIEMKAEIIKEIWQGLFTTPSGSVVAIIGTIGATFSALASILGGTLMTNLILLESKFGTLSKTLTLLKGALSTTFGAIGTIIAGAILTVTNFVSQWKNGFDAVKSVLMAFGEALVAIGAVILGACGGWVAAVIAAVAHIVANIFIAIKEARDNGLAWGDALLTGLLEGIKNATVGLLEGIAELCTKVILWFKELFGINSPSTIMAEMGGFIVEGLFQGISLSEFWGSIQTWFNDKLTNMKQWCSDTWTSISTTATEKWNSIKETVGTSVSKIGETISTWGQGASDNFNTIMSNIGSVIGDALGIDTANWGDGLNEILGLSSDFGKGIVDYFGDIGKSIANNLTNGANGGITALNGLVSAYKRAKAEDYASQLGAYNAQVASLKAAGAKVIPSFSPRPFPKISLPSLFSFIPRLASGGVLTSPTMAMLGEYPGAANNPEIATPQSLLRETIDASNGEMVSAFAQMTNQIITAINELDMNVSIGDDVIANSASRGDKAYKKRTGKSLFAY